MEAKELVSLLRNQKNNLNALLSAVTQKQKALVSIDYEMLEDSIVKEEHILMNIQQTEKLRVNIVGALYKEFSIASNSVRLKEFVEKTKSIIGKEISTEILTLEKEIKEVIVRINNINQQNKYLIDQSRSFIKETIQSILNLKKSLLDKRV